MNTSNQIILHLAIIDQRVADENLIEEKPLEEFKKYYKKQN
jgi:hypothetical protein